MIVVLSRDPALQNRWQRLWRQPSIREVDMLGESVMLVHPGTKPNWEKLARKLGRYAGRVLAGEGIQLPKERPWKPLDVSKVEERLLSATLISQAEQQDWVGVYDPEGKLTMLTWELAQHFPRVTVFCSFRERYHSLCEDLLEQLGAAIEVSSHWEALAVCPLIGSMSSPDFRLHWQGIFLLPGKGELPPIEGRTGTLLQQLPLPIPPELLPLCPMDLSPQSLYLALLKEGRVKAPEGLTYLLPEEVHQEKQLFPPNAKNL